MRFKNEASKKQFESAYIGSINEQNQMNGFGILVEGPVKMIGNWYCGKLYGEGTFENQVTGEKYSG